MRNIKIIVAHIIFGCYAIIPLYAVNGNYPLGARSAAMSTSSVVMADAWAAANNQAGLGFLEKAVAAMYYQNVLNVTGLSLQAGTISVPIHSTVVGINYRYIGFSKFNESKFGLAVGKRIGERFALGVQVDYFRTHIAGNYGDVGVLSGEVGLLCEPVENLIIGAHVFNVSQSKQKNNYDERLPTIMRFGIGYKIKEKTIISAETEKDLRLDAIFKCGIEYMIVENLYMRSGLSTGNLYQYSFGLGYGWKHLAVDVALNHHRFLGYSPHISLMAKM